MQSETMQSETTPKPPHPVIVQQQQHPQKHEDEGEEEHSPGLLDRVKQVVGLGPKSHKTDILHEEEVSPRHELISTKQEQQEEEAPLITTTPTIQEKKEQALEQQKQQPSQRVVAQKLAQPHEIEAIEKQLRATTPLGEPALQKHERLVPPASSLPALSAEKGIESHAISEYQGQKQQQHVLPSKPAVEDEAWPKQPQQGNRVKVSSIPAMHAIMTPPLQEKKEKKEEVTLTEVMAHEEPEVPMHPAEVSQIKAAEHAERMDKQQRIIDTKHQELDDLRRRAHYLEEQSAVLFEQAEEEKHRVERVMKRKEEIEQEEMQGYISAEEAEKERRAVIERAKPAVKSAEELERKAIFLKQQAAESEYHGQVLENRARSLIQESEDMAALAMDKFIEMKRISTELMIVRQEIDEMKLQIDTQAAKDLPSYIQDCQREIGILSHRIAQLKEEISWAEGEIASAREEADMMRRIIVSKEGNAARLLLRVNQLRDDAEVARHRSRRAAEEAREPAQLAKEKYGTAWQSRQEAEEVESQAIETQKKALKVVEEAVEPKEERQRALRMAAEKEMAAKAVGREAEAVYDARQHHVYEAKVKEATAEKLEREVEEREKELERMEKVREGERREKEALVGGGGGRWEIEPVA